MKPTEDFWHMAGMSLVILAILLGMGSCGALWGWANPPPAEPPRPAPQVPGESSEGGA